MFDKFSTVIHNNVLCITFWHGYEDTRFTDDGINTKSSTLLE